MAQRPTIKTIAKETGLSTATVSKALNASPQVRPRTRDKVLQAAKELGYELNISGVQLRTGKTYQIAMVTVIASPDDDEWAGVGYTQLISGISRAIAHTPYRVVQYQVASFDESFEVIKRIVQNKKADGIIISGTRINDPRISFMQEQEFPFVTYGTSDASAPHAYVDTDNRRIVTICVDRLLSKGHRRIAMINAREELNYTQNRVEAYTASLSRAGLSFDPSLIAYGRLTPAFGREQLFEMSMFEEPPTAYICANEATAMGVLSGFQVRGMEHGRDAVVIATDDLNVSQYFSPPITTCYLPISKPSETLGQFMLDLIGGEDPINLQKLFVPDLIERGADTCNLEKQQAQS
ncbi:substrate-binding domain-containing protein [Pseudovibrio brasiliensis]|uniref:Substrate-binding domain-containing protein n=1 Tax=Pseudovibrio brasiliensis TaxID=1898042 RepID=A0ABX8AML5_9HYPH|nr:substrate-binding domain-containing protein [Pseudovibrio brasiliensis]QUS56313.1 substrate-binding domain-containing protein [Pseudovibrio brasiliensis]